MLNTKIDLKIEPTLQEKTMLQQGNEIIDDSIEEYYNGVSESNSDRVSVTDDNTSDGTSSSTTSTKSNSNTDNYDSYSNYDDEYTKYTNGQEAFEFIDKAFYKVDKAFEKGVSGIMNYFNTMNIAIDGLIEYKTKTPNIKDLYNARTTLVTHMKEGFKFYKIADKKSPVMLGLDINLPELFTIVNDNSYFVKSTLTVLDNFNNLLDDILDSKADSISINIDKNELQALNKAVTAMNKNLDKVTSNKVLVDRKPIKELVKNLNDLNTLTKNNLHLGSNYRMEDLEDIYSMNETILTKLKAIYDSINKNKGAMDRTTLNMFSDYISNVAKYITAVAYSNYVYYQLINMNIAVIKVMDITKEDHTVLDTLAYGIKDGYNVIKDIFK